MNPIPALRIFIRGETQSDMTYEFGKPFPSRNDRVISGFNLGSKQSFIQRNLFFNVVVIDISGGFEW